MSALETEVERLRAQATTLANEGKAQEAIDLYLEILSLDGSDSDAKAELGRLYLELGENSAAVSMLQSVLPADLSADTAFNLALGRQRLKRFDEAWTALHLCLKWSQEQPRLLERAAELALLIAPKTADPKAVRQAVVDWAGGTPAGKTAAEQLR